MSAHDTRFNILLKHCFQLLPNPLPPIQRLSERKSRNINLRNLPCLPPITRRHLPRSTTLLVHSLIVVWIRRVQRDDRVDPLMRCYSTAVCLGAFDGAAPAERVAVAGGQCGDLAAVDEHELRVVACCVVEFVWIFLLALGCKMS